MIYTETVSIVCWKDIQREVWQNIMVLNIIYLCWHSLSTHGLFHKHPHAQKITKDIQRRALEADTHPCKVISRLAVTLSSFPVTLLKGLLGQEGEEELQHLNQTAFTFFIEV